jgi:hypothetical protein
MEAVSINSLASDEKHYPRMEVVLTSLASDERTLYTTLRMEVVPTLS